MREDDSYCPTELSVMAGTNACDLQEVCSRTLEHPIGWVALGLTDGADSKGVMAFTFRLVIFANYNGGKDTHVRQLLIFGPKKSSSTLEMFDDFR